MVHDHPFKVLLFTIVTGRILAALVCVMSLP